MDSKWVAAATISLILRGIATQISLESIVCF